MRPRCDGTVGGEKHRNTTSPPPRSIPAPAPPPPPLPDTTPWIRIDCCGRRRRTWAFFFPARVAIDWLSLTFCLRAERKTEIGAGERHRIWIWNSFLLLRSDKYTAKQGCVAQTRFSSPCTLQDFFPFFLRHLYIDMSHKKNTSSNPFSYISLHYQLFFPMIPEVMERQRLRGTPLECFAQLDRLQLPGVNQRGRKWREAVLNGGDGRGRGMMMIQEGSRPEDDPNHGQCGCHSVIIHRRAKQSSRTSLNAPSGGGLVVLQPQSSTLFFFSFLSFSRRRT